MTQPLTDADLDALERGLAGTVRCNECGATDGLTPSGGACGEEAAEENSGGTYWSYGLWVGGVRVRNPDSLRADLVELSEGRSVDVTVVDAG